ncbi:hypothetical protein WMY93_021660 [Mugilogobius chulae]|uniref:Fibulin-1 n=1 Tax=Mugilogobius chulae TaxID=88201 RepID=A0AAW0NEI6_9GOBI
MALWIVALCCLYAVALGQESQPTVQQCCADGRDRGLKGHDCSVLPLMSSDHTCMVAQEQCCSATVETRLCDVGMKMAKQKAVCERPFLQGDLLEAQVSKMCCDCCVLGQTVARQGLGCELEGMILGKLCEHTARACCNQINATTETLKAPVKGLEKNNEKDKTGTTVTAKPKEDTHSCKDSICSQLCLGNGTCGCYDGYQLKDDGVNCEDVNECLTGSHNCIFGLFCINTEGSFRCQRETGCGTGYELTDNNRCQDIDECLLGTHNCGPEFACTNTAGSFRCHPKESCAPGYIQDAIGSCIDINECVVYSSPCPLGQTCINSLGSFTCRRNTSPVGGCENTEGSYKCSCTSGFKLASDGRNCEDLNECETNPCSQECANVYGSYQCYCRRGYQLSDIDGNTCEDIDECALPTGGHVCSYRCANAPGSFYCTCPTTGYTLAPNGRSCQDIDECSTGSHTCSVSQSCFNVQGGYRCLSFECPLNFRQAAPGNDGSVRCIKSCQPNDFSCSVNPVHLITYTVLSLPTFRDFTGPEGVVRQVKPITGPMDVVVEVAMNYVKSGVVSHRNIVKIHLFISSFWF